LRQRREAERAEPDAFDGQHDVDPVLARARVDDIECVVAVDEAGGRKDDVDAPEDQRAERCP
jgi:hypothetical protein